MKRFLEFAGSVIAGAAIPVVFAFASVPIIWVLFQWMKFWFGDPGQ